MKSLKVALYVFSSVSALYATLFVWDFVRIRFGHLLTKELDRLEWEPRR